MDEGVGACQWAAASVSVACIQRRRGNQTVSGGPVGAPASLPIGRRVYGPCSSACVLRRGRRAAAGQG